MGQYVCVGIQNKVRVPKSGLDKFKDEYSHEELLGYFEMTHLLMDAFERRETEDAYVYQLKDKLIETELIPFCATSILCATRRRSITREL